MWDFRRKYFTTHDVAEHPRLAAFVAQLPTYESGEYRVTRSFLEATGLRGLPLYEWAVRDEVGPLFAQLRSAGSTEGYFIECANPGRYHRCALTPQIADEILREDLFGNAGVFIDDSFRVAIAFWFSDLTCWCMMPELLGAWLDERPWDWTLYHDQPIPQAASFDQALEAAIRRIEDWVADHPRDNGLLGLIEDFAWQRTAPT